MCYISRKQNNIAQVRLMYANAVAVAQLIEL